jgi:hypothetical protein
MQTRTHTQQQQTQTLVNKILTVDVMVPARNAPLRIPWVTIALHERRGFGLGSADDEEDYGGGGGGRREREEGNRDGEGAYDDGAHDDDDDVDDADDDGIRGLDDDDDGTGGGGRGGGGGRSSSSSSSNINNNNDSSSKGGGGKNGKAAARSADGGDDANVVHNWKPTRRRRLYCVAAVPLRHVVQDLLDSGSASVENAEGGVGGGGGEGAGSGGRGGGTGSSSSPSRSSPSRFSNASTLLRARQYDAARLLPSPGRQHIAGGNMAEPGRVVEDGLGEEFLTLRTGDMNCTCEEMMPM